MRTHVVRLDGSRHYITNVYFRLGKITKFDLFIDWYAPNDPRLGLIRTKQTN
jgi:hypothetical protein